MKHTFTYFLAPVLLGLVGTGAAWAHSDNSSSAGIAVTTEEVNPWSHLDVNADPDNFQFAIVSDRTGGHRPGVFPSALDKLNLLQPEFVMSVGDLIEGYSEDLEQLDREWTEFEGFVEQLQMPFFYLPGNHDITNEVMARVWEERLGASYYYFVYRNVLFLCLNTEGPPSTQISDTQRNYFAKVLDNNRDVRWTLIFQHKPLWNYDEETGWQAFEELLVDRPHTVFAGHFHRYTKHKRNNQNYLVLATTGGGSRLRGPQYGEFDHVVWVTMSDRGPRIANLMLSGIWDENIRTEEVKALLDPVIRGHAVGSEPIHLREEAFFTDGTGRFRLTNDADLPMRTEIDFSAWPGSTTIARLWAQTTTTHRD